MCVCAGVKGMKTCECVRRGQRNENMSVYAGDKGMSVCVRRGQRNEYV